MTLIKNSNRSGDVVRVTTSSRPLSPPEPRNESSLPKTKITEGVLEYLATEQSSTPRSRIRSTSLSYGQSNDVLLTGEHWSRSSIVVVHENHFLVVDPLCILDPFSPRTSPRPAGPVLILRLGTEDGRGPELNVLSSDTRFRTLTSLPTITGVDIFDLVLVHEPLWCILMSNRLPLHTTNCRTTGQSRKYLNRNPPWSRNGKTSDRDMWPHYYDADLRPVTSVNEGVKVGEPGRYRKFSTRRLGTLQLL